VKDPIYMRSGFVPAVGLTIIWIVRWVTSGALPEQEMWTALGAWGWVFGSQIKRPTAPLPRADAP